MVFLRRVCSRRTGYSFCVVGSGGGGVRRVDAPRQIIFPRGAGGGRLVGASALRDRMGFAALGSFCVVWFGGRRVGAQRHIRFLPGGVVGGWWGGKRVGAHALSGRKPPPLPEGERAKPRRWVGALGTVSVLLAGGR